MLSEKREKAAQLVSEDKLTNEEIAEQLGIGKKTLQRWKHNEAFAARVNAISEAFAERALKHGIARRELRVSVLNEVHEKLLTVIEERSKDPELQGIPGGQTGLVTKMLKGIGKGNDFQVVEVYEVDNGTLRELRAVQEQVAEELGQKVTKHEHTGAGGGALVISARIKLLQQLAG